MELTCECDVRKLYDNPAAQIMHMTLKPGESLKPNKTPVDAVFYVLEGEPTIHINGESIHVVEKIIQSFRKGEKDNASFWINNIKGKYILIQYFAVRNETNAYKGVIEVSQEISEIKMIEGEKRLLDW